MRSNFLISRRTCLKGIGASLALPLLESGLDSLCVAIIVANLDDELGLDPFAAGNVDMPVTLGDFIRLYEHATT